MRIRVNGPPCACQWTPPPSKEETWPPLQMPPPPLSKEETRPGPLTWGEGSARCFCVGYLAVLQRVQ